MYNQPETYKAPEQPSNMNPNQNVGLSPQQLNMANKPCQALAPDNQQISEFVNNLVVAMLGVQVLDIVEEKREEMIKKCLSMFNDFIIGYFEEHHTQVDVTRLKAAQAYPESGVFEKFPDLNEKFEKAYLEFLKQVEISWKEEDNQEGSTENNQEFGQEETLE